MKNDPRITSIGYWDIDIADNKVFWSDELYRIFGFKPNEIEPAADTFISYIKKEDLPENKEICSDIANINKPYKYQFNIIDNRGKEKYIHCQRDVKLDQNGKAIRIFGYCEDTTKIKKSQEKTEHNERYLRTVLNTNKNLIILAKKAKDICDCNKAFLDFFGYESLEEFKKEHTCLCDFIEKTDDKEYINRVTDGLHWIEYINQNPEKGYKLLIKKDKKKYSFLANARKIEKDKKNRSVISLTDITELENSKRKFKNLAEEISDLSWEQDSQGRFTYLSPRVKDILGYEPEELLGKTPFDLMPQEAAKTAKEYFDKAVESKLRIANKEDMLIQKNGTPIPIEISAYPVLDEAGELVGFRGITRDIAARKKLEEELRLKDEMMITQSRQAAMGDMIAMIAHQWRQPITVIAMAVNNLKLDMELGNEITPSTLDHLIDIVSDQTQHLSKTIDDFRNFFKPNKEKKETTVCKVIDDAMKIVGKSLENNNIEIRRAGSCSKKIYIFENELLQVFLNIITNAKDALKSINPEKAFIQISVIDGNRSVKTIVCDNGGGIPESAMKKIGEPYFSTKGQSGTGLGIYMSKTIIEKHLNGSIEWENSDVGACFTITLPIEEILV